MFYLSNNTNASATREHHRILPLQRYPTIQHPILGRKWSMTWDRLNVHVVKGLRRVYEVASNKTLLMPRRDLCDGGLQIPGKASSPKSLATIPSSRPLALKRSPQSQAPGSPGIWLFFKSGHVSTSADPSVSSGTVPNPIKNRPINTGMLLTRTSHEGQTLSRFKIEGRRMPSHQPLAQTGVKNGAVGTGVQSTTVILASA